MPDAICTDHSTQVAVDTGRKRTASTKSDSFIFNCSRWKPLPTHKGRNEFTLHSILDLLDHDMALPTVDAVNGASTLRERGAYAHLLQLNASYFHRDLRSVEH